MHGVYRAEKEVGRRIERTFLLAVFAFSGPSLNGDCLRFVFVTQPANCNAPLWDGFWLLYRLSAFVSKYSNISTVSPVAFVSMSA